MTRPLSGYFIRHVVLPTPHLLASVFILGLVGLASYTAPPARAVEIDHGEWTGSFDTTLSHGLTFRVARPDYSLTTLNTDDGTRNYSRGLVSNTSKFTSELELNHGNFGLFTRFTGFIDFENRNGSRNHIPLSEEAKDVAGDDIELLDLYVTNTFNLDGAPVDVRLGKHVLNWGESTFIQGGLNVINPFDVTKLRTPGAELREGLVPVPMLSASIAPTDKLTVEGFYQLKWEHTEADASGAYFSTNDYFGAGGNTAFLEIPGTEGNIGKGLGALTPAINAALSTAPQPLQPLAVSDPDPGFLGIPRHPDEEPGDSGQWGLALRYFAEALNDTEFGFYFINHHSRLPVVSALPSKDGYDTGLAAATALGNPTDAISRANCAQSLRLPGLCSDTQLGQFTAGLSATQRAQFNQGVAMQAAGVARTAGLVAIDRYAEQARYYAEYPEDIQTMGISFNTVHANSGWAFQGEYTHHSDMPLQRDEQDLLTEGLRPITAALQLGRLRTAGQSPLSPIELGQLAPPVRAAVERGDLATAIRLQGAAVQTLQSQLDKPVQGYIRRDVSQFQVTATKLFGSTFGADTAVVVAEAAVMHVHDMPDDNTMPLDSHGISEEKADATSFGYRAIVQLDYNNAIGAARLSPYLQWQHDVNGSSPTPGGAFLEGRKAVTLGLGVGYLDRWQGDVSYTMERGSTNLLSDRDFIVTSIKYSF